MASTHSYGKRPNMGKGAELAGRQYGIKEFFGRKYLIKSVGWEVDGVLKFTTWDVLGEFSRWGCDPKEGEKAAGRGAERFVRATHAVVKTIARAMGDGEEIGAMPRGRLLYRPLGQGPAADAIKEQLLEAEVYSLFHKYIEDELKYQGVKKLGMDRYPCFARFEPKPEEISRN